MTGYLSLKTNPAAIDRDFEEKRTLHGNWPYQISKEAIELYREPVEDDM
jgi:hypothetical protein